MKKSLAILMSVALLFSALVCGMVLTTTASDVNPLKPDMFADFTTEEAYEKSGAIFPGTTSCEYDGDAVKITYKTNGAQLQACMGGTITASTAEYKVLAMKVKIGTIYDHPQRGKGPWLWLVRPGTGKDVQPTTNVYNTNTTDWQLVTVDMTGAENGKAAWTQMQVYLDELGGQGGTTKTMWFQWAGYFKSVADAQAFYNGETGDSGESGEDVDVNALKPDMFADFTTEAAYEKSGAIFPGTASCTYDGDAVKITYGKTNGAQMQACMGGTITASTAEYKVLAMKVKIDFTYAHPQRGRGPWLWLVRPGTGKDAQPSTNAYNTNTTDWQLVTVDMTGAENNKAAWTQMQVYLDELGGTTADVKTMWFQWAGYFKSAADAKLFYDNYTGEIPSTTPIANKPSRQTNAAKDALRFGFDVATADYAGISYAAGDYAAAQAAGNYARKLDNAKMKINGQMVDIVGFGALITKSNLADDAFVAGAAGVKAVEATNLYGLDADKLTYTVRITGIPADAQDAVVYARSYVAYNDGGETVYVYGDIVSDSVNGAMAE